nr:MAG TPA: hypothetical protein [Caudoviricetes sp.]
MPEKEGARENGGASEKQGVPRKKQGMPETQKEKGSQRHGP